MTDTKSTDPTENMTNAQLARFHARALSVSHNDLTTLGLCEMPQVAGAVGRMIAAELFLREIGEEL